ncbi:MAG: trypsin-like peptidase domain-containing protein [Planctomycetaceae bacterium]|nr:trypsin-like peptidase domain-containing protein [Planctomycetaceae bacterium]
MSERTKREALQYLAFVGCFLAGLATTDLFMGDGPARLNRPSSALDASGSATATSLRQQNNKSIPTRRMSWNPNAGPSPSTHNDELATAKRLEQQRIAVVKQVMPAVVAIFGLERQGGGSGVVIHPSGLALTNHHVVSAAGAEGWGGLSDGKLYRWKLVGNDPGGDLALIRLIHDQPGVEFPFVRLGDSDRVEVGDWTLVMGNPFTLAEDYRPTVTYGIVSGVKRYQPGMNDTLLVYGNCIQVDTSINPGNSGGPLFDMDGNLIGINGRASFEFRERGRVNVGLGYAISVNQCRNFLPELLATKLIQHGTLDAVFGDRDGRVLCTAIYDDADIGKLGLELGDELLEFEGQPIATANQFTNLICTLPAGWPAHLKIRKSDGRTSEIRMRLIGLPYPKMDAPPPQVQPPGEKPEGDQPKPDPNAPPTLQQEIEASHSALFKFMSEPPGLSQYPDVNREFADWLWQRYLSRAAVSATVSAKPAGGRWLIRERWTSPTGESTVWNLTIDANQREILAEPMDANGDPTTATAWDWSKLDAVGLGGQKIQFKNGKWSTQATDGASEQVEWQELRVRDLARSPIGMQLWFLSQALNWHAGNSVAMTLDGADRINGTVAARLSWEADGQRQYVWLSLDDWTKPAETELLKLSNDVNGRESAGAVRFLKWSSELPIPWASHRQLVQGLFEDPIATVETLSIEVLENK